MAEPKEDAIDASFNDAELADIMSEIEGLEKEALEGETTQSAVDAEAAAVATSAGSSATEFSGPDDILEENFKEETIAAKKEEVAAPEQQEKLDETESAQESKDEAMAEIVPLMAHRPATSGPSQDINTKIATNGQFQLGAMVGNFTLSFQVHGQTLNLQVDEVKGVTLSLPDGATLVVPLKKKVA